MVRTTRRAGLLGVFCILLTAGSAKLGSEMPPPGGVGGEPPTPVPLAAPTREPSPSAAKMLAGQPIPFVPNLGQWEGDFSHRVRMGPMTVFLEKRGWAFTLTERKKKAPDAMSAGGAPPFERGRGVAVRMSFTHGAAAATPLAEGRLPGVHNYFIGDDPARWRFAVPLHDAVLLRGLYPGIDVRTRSEKGLFEYDLLVAAGADLDRVTVSVEGADGLSLDREGALIIDTALGPVRQPAPRTWQVDALGQRHELRCHYVLNGSRSFGFASPGRDRDLALVVDPALVYSTFLGGTDAEDARALALDASGAAVICGETLSTDFPVTAGAISGNPSGGRDVFVTRIHSSGVALISSTYLGGAGDDYAYGLALDASGGAAVCGTTSSPNFPTTPGAFSATPSGAGYDAFVLRLAPTGVTLVYSTRVGGSGVDDVARAIAVDLTGTATICGFTDSTDFPVTPGAFDTSHNGGFWDGFVTRITPTGGGLIYSTFLGGSGTTFSPFDHPVAIALEPSGSATVAGSTTSTNFPTTTGAYSTVHAGGFTDAFVTRLHPSGTALIYSTYLGGTASDFVFGLALGTNGSATVCGTTSSANFPTTLGAFDTTLGGASDVFVTRLNPQGSGLVHSTLLGGLDDQLATGIALDPTGAPTICGYTWTGGWTATFPTTPGAYDVTFNGGDDAFLARFDPTLGTLTYSTFLGGIGDDRAVALDLGSDGSTTLCGTTESFDFPTTALAFDPTINLSRDAFVARLDPGPTVSASQLAGPGTPLTLHNAFLILGTEYYNIFSLDLCPPGPGSGPFLGLCATTPANIQFIVTQVSLPLNSPPFHFTAPGPSVSWGPYSLGPGTLDALCLAITGGVITSFSPVTRITIQ